MDDDWDDAALAALDAAEAAAEAAASAGGQKRQAPEEQSNAFECSWDEDDLAALDALEEHHKKTTTEAAAPKPENAAKRARRPPPPEDVDVDALVAMEAEMEADAQMQAMAEDFYAAAEEEEADKLPSKRPSAAPVVVALGGGGDGDGDDDDWDDAALAALDAAEAAASASASSSSSASSTTTTTTRPAAPLKAVTGDPAATLERCFGFGEFRSGQREVVEAVLQGKDVAVFWATGQGKSLCYQLPSLHRGPGSLTLVVSPLLALIQDQVTKLNNTVGQAAFWSSSPHSSSSSSSYSSSSSAKNAFGAQRRSGKVAVGLTGHSPPGDVDDALAGLYPLVYITPEKLLLGNFLHRLTVDRVALVAIDEAHCVSQWGHDFRPEYLKLGQVRRTLGPSYVPPKKLATRPP